MKSCIMGSLLLILSLALMNAQARTLTENCRFNSKPEEPTGVVSPLLEGFIDRGTKAPPPPKSATPDIEMIATGTLNNYERTKHPPPAPKDASPTRPSIRRWSGGGARAIIAQLLSV